VGGGIGILTAFVIASLLKPTASGRSAGLAVFADAQPIRELLAISEEQPRDPEWQLRLGREFLRQGHYLSARAAFRQAQALGAGEVPVLWGFSACSEGLDEDDEALEQLRRLTELDPQNLSVPLRVATIQGRLGHHGEAVAALDGVRVDARGKPALRDPGGPLAGLERLAVAYGLEKKWGKSLLLAERLLKERPNAEAGHAIAGQALLMLGKPDAAAAHFREALARQPNRLDLKLSLARCLQASVDPKRDAELANLLEPILQTGTPSGEVLYSLAGIYERRRRWSWAAAYYAAAAKAGINSDFSYRKAFEYYKKAGQPEHALFTRGRRLEMAGELDGASSVYRELIRLRPKSDAGYRHLARCLVGKGDVTTAIRTLNQAAKLSSASPRVFMRLALAYHQTGERKAKDAAWAEFRKRSPQEEYLFEANEAQDADSEGRLDDAEKHLRRCVELQPNLTEYRVRLASLLIEKRADKTKVREGEQLLEEALPRVREDPEVLVDLATAYRSLGMRREAIWTFRHAIDLQPGNGRPYQLLGEVLTESGFREEGEQMLTLFKRFRQYMQAVDVLTLRMKRNPRDTDVAQRLAALQERSGALFDARLTYLGILRVDPQADWARKRLAEIRTRLGDTLGSDESAEDASGG
jgi:tetratricopeptide (TPR) repeat protein